MNYKDFDTKKEGYSASKYAELHVRIIDSLKSSPKNIFELTDELKDSQYIISGQIQYLKTKNKIDSKRFEGIVYYGLKKQLRPSEILT